MTSHMSFQSERGLTPNDQEPFAGLIFGFAGHFPWPIQGCWLVNDFQNRAPKAVPNVVRHSASQLQEALAWRGPGDNFRAKKAVPCNQVPDIRLTERSAEAGRAHPR